MLIATAALILWQRENIAQLAGPAAAVFYLIVSLVPAILLFGLFRTVAKVTGKLYGLPIELGGPAALFIIVLWLLLKVTPPAEPPTKPTDTTATTSTTAAPPTVTTGSVTAVPPAREHIERFPSGPQDVLTVDFGGLVLNASLATAAFPHLHDLGITITDIQPPTSEVVIKNNRAYYQGMAIHATTSENFLTQQGNAGSAFFTLTTPRAFQHASITRPQLLAATGAGIIHPAWQVTAYNTAGHAIAVAGEPLIASYDGVPQQTLTLDAPPGETIARLRIASDPRINGVNTAAFNGVLIERITFTN